MSPFVLYIKRAAERELTPEEHELIELRKRKGFGGVDTNSPLIDGIASPMRAGLATGVGGAVGGAALGGMVGADGKKTQAALLGAVLGALGLGGGMYGFTHWVNGKIENQLRRLPPGATVMDSVRLDYDDNWRKKQAARGGFQASSNNILNMSPFLQYLIKSAAPQTFNHQQYMPQYPRRSLTELETSDIAAAKSRVLPRIFTSEADPISADMNSPLTRATLLGLLGAGGGALGGAAVSDGKTLHTILGALLGGAGGAGVGYMTKKRKNETLEERMRRLPEGAVRRDMVGDPVYQAERDRRLAVQNNSGHGVLTGMLAASMMR